MRSLIALLLSLWLAPALAQVPMTGAGKGTPGGFVGPLDVFTSSPFLAVSCARALSGAKAAAQANLCELVDSAAPTTPICTLKAKLDGFVDLTTASCTGSLTPAAACAAATGGVCNIWKMYDQSGNGRDLSFATAANQVVARFSSTPTGTLIAVDCNAGGSRVIDTASTQTQAQPLTMSGVMFHITAASTCCAFGSSNTAVYLTTNATQGVASGGTALGASASDNTWHAVQGLLNGNGTSSAVNVDGSDTTGAAGTTGFSSNSVRLCRANSSQFGGYVAEALIWAASSTSTDRNNLAANQKSATYGYNF